MNTDCPLCSRVQAVAVEPKGEVVWEFPHSIAFLGVHQFYRGYVVLVCRHHERELSGLSGEIRTEFLEEMCLVAKAIEQAFSPLKMNYELLGNQVPHLHWHLFPRYANDPQRLQPVWVALHQSDSNPSLQAQLKGDQADRPAIRDALHQQLEILKAPKILS